MLKSGESCSLSIVGDGSSGKSTIINYFKTEGFLPVYKQTVGIEFYEKQLKLRGDVFLSLRLWDIGGQSIHSKNLDTYLSNSQVVFIVYDLTNIDSFNNLTDWLTKVRKSYKGNFIYVVGNKLDLYHMRVVRKDQHDRFIFENRLAGGIFVSAKTGENITRSFYQIAGEVMGMPLDAYELAFYDKVLTAHIQSDGNEGRTLFADEIEAEDLAAEAAKNRSSRRCICS